MRCRARWSLGLVTAMAAAAVVAAQDRASTADTTAALWRVFERPPDEARVMMRWWWFGPTVTPAGLDRDLQAMREAGIGGVEVQPVYPLTLDGGTPDTQARPFLSPGFLDAVAHARATAARLGLRFDLTLGSGWPFGGPGVSVADAAGALRIETLALPAGARAVGLPAIGAGEQLIAVFLTVGSSVPTVPDAFRRLDGTPAEGRLLLAAPLDRPHKAWVFIRSRTGMMVKRPAIGGEGFVLDHYDRGALDRYLGRVGTPLLDALASSRPYAIFCDSLEVFGSDWTPGLLDAFEARYGYDLADHLPALVTGDDDRSRGVRHDWGQLLTDRLETQFLGPLAQWAHEHDTRLRVQTYGIPPARPSSAGLVDLPEGEGAQWRTVTSVRWASSAAHVFGRPVASSETWTWLHSPSFAATPLDVKVEADRHFLQGITQLIGHGWPNTPAGVDWPGARFYAAAVLSDANPWWVVMPDVARYLQRTSAMLREGTAVNDVALYLPTSDAWSRMRPGKVHLFEMLRDHVGTTLVGSLLDAGFGFDVVDDARLQVDARVDGRELVIGKARFRAVVVPDAAIVPPQTMDLLASFARAGGTVIATRQAPLRAPGFRSGANAHAHVARVSETLFTGTSPLGEVVPRDADAGTRLAARLTPDVRWAAEASSLGFVHRRVGDTDVYFVANTTNRAVRTTAAFRVAASRADLWDPRTGVRHALAVTRDGTTASAEIALEPYASTFVVFGGAATVASPDTCAPRGTQELAGGWQLEAPGVAARPLPTLSSWHELADMRFHSGVVTYRRDIEVGAGVLTGACPVWLDFGAGSPRPEETLTNGMRAWLDAPVRDGAIVLINGQPVGTVWTAPFRVDLRPALRAGHNTVEVRVGNTALNRWAERPQPDYRLLHLRHGKRFDPQDIDKVVPQPSGIIGTPRLVY